MAKERYLLYKLLNKPFVSDQSNRYYNEDFLNELTSSKHLIKYFENEIRKILKNEITNEFTDIKTSHETLEKILLSLYDIGLNNNVCCDLNDRLFDIYNNNCKKYDRNVKDALSINEDFFSALLKKEFSYDYDTPIFECIKIENEKPEILLKKIAYLSNLFSHSIIKNLYYLNSNRANHIQYNKSYLGKSDFDENRFSSNILKLSSIVYTGIEKKDLMQKLKLLNDYFQGSQTDIDDDILKESIGAFNKTFKHLINDNFLPTNFLNFNNITNTENKMPLARILNNATKLLNASWIVNDLFSIKNSALKQIFVLKSKFQEKSNSNENFGIIISKKLDTNNTIKGDPTYRIMLESCNNIAPTVMHISKNSFDEIINIFPNLNIPDIEALDDKKRSLTANIPLTAIKSMITDLKDSAPQSDVLATINSYNNKQNLALRKASRNRGGNNVR